MYQERSYSQSSSMSFGPGLMSPVIRAIIIASVALFIGQYFFPVLTDFGGLTPTLFLRDFPFRGYELVTYIFLHAGIFHIFFNLFTLWMFGTEVEYTLGRSTFLWFFFACGIAGGLLHLLVWPSAEAVLVGASGAIYGVMVAYWLMFPDRHLYLYFLFPVKVKYAIPGMMLVGFLFAAPNVAHMAHLGGAVCGFLFLKVDWRWARLAGTLKRLRYEQQTAKLEARRTQAEEMMKRVDAILDKINEVGIDNLTKEERKFLEEASSNLSRKEDLKNR